MKDFSHLNHETKVAIDTFLKQAKLVATRSKASRCSDKTFQEYARIAKRILKKCSVNGQSIEQYFARIESKSTFFKGTAAINCYVTDIGIEAVKALIDTYCPIADHNIKKAASDIQQILNVIQKGMTCKRKKRKSKRTALSGLPDDWREQICNYNKKSKYYAAFLVASLTGCRPAELCNGILVSYRNDGSEKVLTFKIKCAKFTESGGQAWREIIYRASNPQGILADAIALVEFGDKTISVDNPTNFTVEVRRIAADLWPDHKKPITAYCFRHQFAADLKAHGDGDLVSLALGHRSSKTKKVYGQRGQRRGKYYDISVNASYDLSTPIASSSKGGGYEI